jgi:hypothetical protein
MASEDLLVGLIALALLPIVAWRIRRGLREGRLPIYRSYVKRDEQPGRFRFMLLLHGLSLLLVAFVCAELLLGLGLRGNV